MCPAIPSELGRLWDDRQFAPESYKYQGIGRVQKWILSILLNSPHFEESVSIT